jgi:hypothetical protein
VPPPGEHHLARLARKPIAYQPAQPVIRYDDHTGTEHQVRVLVLALAVGSAASTVCLFVWAYQLDSLVLALFGLVTLGMSVALEYGVAELFQPSDTPGAERIIQQRGIGWVSATPLAFRRYQQTPRERTTVNGQPARYAAPVRPTGPRPRADGAPTASASTVVPQRRLHG